MPTGRNCYMATRVPSMLWYWYVVEVHIMGAIRPYFPSRKFTKRKNLMFVG